MQEPDVPPTGAFVVAFVVGVTPSKWARVWGERMPRHPLTLLPAGDDATALAALTDGSAHVALVRLPVEDAHFSSIPLYIEQAVVVAPKGHAIEALDTVTLADLGGETVLEQAWPTSVELVAANVGVAVMPQSVARALSRRDVVARPLTDAATTQIALVWPVDATTELVEEFIGIVRGRTANSSRGKPAAETAEKLPAKQPSKQPAKQPAKRGAKPPARASRRATPKKRGR